MVRGSSLDSALSKVAPAEGTRPIAFSTSKTPDGTGVGNMRNILQLRAENQCIVPGTRCTTCSTGPWPMSDVAYNLCLAMQLSTCTNIRKKKGRGKGEVLRVISFLYSSCLRCSHTLAFTKSHWHEWTQHLIIIIWVLICACI